MKGNQATSGFALLITLIVVSVIVSIGLTVLDVSLKQVQLSTNAKDSEIAFHAANAGMECARYIRNTQAVAMEAGNTISPSCFSGTLDYNVVTVVPPANIPPTSDDGDAYLYTYFITWGSGDRCSEISTMVMVSDVASSSDPTINGMTVTNIASLTVAVPSNPTLRVMEGYPKKSDGVTPGDKYCAESESCTVLAVKGYNKPCSSIRNANSYGIVQREVLLQY